MSPRATEPAPRQTFRFIPTKPMSSFPNPRLPNVARALNSLRPLPSVDLRPQLGVKGASHQRQRPVLNLASRIQQQQLISYRMPTFRTAESGFWSPMMPTCKEGRTRRSDLPNRSMEPPDWHRRRRGALPSILFVFEVQRSFGWCQEERRWCWV